MEKIFQNFLEIIGSFVDVYTVCFFEIDGETLYLKYSFSLSNSLKKDIKIKIDESIIGWIAKHKKPINIKRDKFSYKILEIYNKDEEIKTYFILPVGNKGVLYLDSKRSYSITEKQQKILFLCAKFFENLINLSENIKKNKENIKHVEFIKKFDYKDFLNYICKIFKFECAMIIKREGDKFIIISSNKTIVPLEIDKDSKLNFLFKRNINKISFIKRDYNDSSIIINKNEKNTLNQIKNLIIIPIISQNVLVGSIVLINGEQDEEHSIEKNLEIFKKIFELKFYEEVFKFEAFKKISSIMNVEDFLTNRDRFANDGFILIKLKSYHRLLKEFPEKIIFRAFFNLIKNIENIFKIEFLKVKIFPNVILLIVEKKKIIEIKNFIEKNLKNTYLKINEKRNVNVNFDILTFNTLSDVIKYLFL